MELSQNGSHESTCVAPPIPVPTLVVRNQRARQLIRIVRLNDLRKQIPPRSTRVKGIQARIQQGRLSEAELRSWLDEALTREEDRTLFGLSTLPGSRP